MPRQTDLLGRQSSSNEQKIYVAGVDPGSVVAGYALLVCGCRYGPAEVLDCGVLDKPAGGGICGVLDAWYDVATKDFGAPVLRVSVAVEGQWIPKIDSAVIRNPKKLSQLMGQINAVVDVAANRGAWMALTDARNWPAVKVAPVQWRRVLGKTTLQGTKRKALKDRAIEQVRLRERELFQRIRLPRSLPDHVAEAILIGDYQAKLIQQQNIFGDTK